MSTSPVDPTPIRPATIGDTRSAYLVRLRCVLALWDEADLAALIAYRRAAEFSSDESALMAALQRAHCARYAVRDAYVSAVTATYPLSVADALRIEVSIARAGTTTQDAIPEADRAERRRRLAWIEAVVADAIWRVEEGASTNDTELPCEVGA